MNCVVGQQRQFLFTDEDVDKQHVILVHPNCSCHSCCRRIAVWQEQPGINIFDTWGIKVVASVMFGDCRGVGSRVEVDIKHGVILDLFGNYTSVSIVPVWIAPDSSTRQGLPTLSFGALSACCGAGGARGLATRTTRRYVIAPDGVVVIEIPPYAYAVEFATEGQDIFVSDLVFVQISGPNVPVKTVLGANLVIPWNIVGGANVISIVNQTQTTYGIEAVFHIGV